MPGPYFNTTNETGATLKEYRGKALTQEEAILEWFRAEKHYATPSTIHKRVLPDAPITSVRRAITNLTAQGKLIKKFAKCTGPLGRREHFWGLP